jgi:hypothetical protein
MVELPDGTGRTTRTGKPLCRVASKGMGRRYARRDEEGSPWRSAPLGYPAHIPTMISVEERQYLWWLAASLWRDRGEIVEMGPWLGGSTACLAEGIRARAVPTTHRLHTVDNFVWRSFMSDRADLDLAPGDSFEEAFRTNVAPYRDVIVLQRSWLPDDVIPGDAWADDVRGDGTHGELFRWHGGPIEIVFVDGAKSWSGLAHLLRELAPALSDDSLLVFQDYKYWGSYWVAMMSELLADALELVHVLPENTVAFRVTGALPVGRIASLPDARAGTGLLERAARRLGDHGDDVGACVVRLATVRFLAHCNDVDGAEAFLRRVSRERAASGAHRQVVAARDWLQAFSGRPVRVRRERAGATRLRPLLRRSRRLRLRIQRPTSASR